VENDAALESATPLAATIKASTPQAQSRRTVSRLGESAKITAILAIMCVAIWFVKRKLQSQEVTLEKITLAISNIPWYHFLIAILLTFLNYLVLTGYDWIAVRHLKKELPMRKIMAGAVVGYSCGNVFGWLLGGNAVRYRLYSSWGFSLLEIIAFVSILSITFWLGLFLLAGIAFVVLPIRLPEETLDMLQLPPATWGYIFLSCVAGYLLSCLVVRKPIRFRDFEVALPPFKLSLMQLGVSAGDFLLASTVLYSLMPPEIIGPGHDQINFSTVLIAYVTAQIGAVISHVPGGYGILEGVLLGFLPHTVGAEVFAAVILFRIVYYFLPVIGAGLIFLYNEHRIGKRPPEMLNGM
jgi:uncharacterized membrane protein YbhN (UPF0104 family)